MNRSGNWQLKFRIKFYLAIFTAGLFKRKAYAFEQKHFQKITFMYYMNIHNVKEKHLTTKTRTTLGIPVSTYENLKACISMLFTESLMLITDSTIFTANRKFQCPHLHIAWAVY